jgi:hypothetical protein
VDYALEMSGVDADGQQDVRRQVRTVLEVMKVFRSLSSITYAENGALVTHDRIIIRDVE